MAEERRTAGAPEAPGTSGAPEASEASGAPEASEASGADVRPPRDGDGGSQREDALLAARAGEGDEQAFETLVRRHSPVLLRLAHRLLDDRGEAEEAVQDAFVNAWRRLPEFRADAAFLTWMYRIVTNRCLTRLRTRRPTTDLEAVPEPAAPEHQASPERAAEGTAALRALSAVLTELTPEQRACWVLRELHGLSYEDIAAAVGTSPQAVRGRVFRVRRHLTEAMSAWR